LKSCPGGIAQGGQIKGKVRKSAVLIKTCTPKLGRTTKTGGKGGYLGGGKRKAFRKNPTVKKKGKQDTMAIKQKLEKKPALCSERTKG